MRWDAFALLRIYETVDCDTLAARATSFIVGRDGSDWFTALVFGGGIIKGVKRGVALNRFYGILVVIRHRFLDQWLLATREPGLERFGRTLWRQTGLNI